MSSTPRYVPILKSRQGELDALQSLALNIRRNCYPLMEIIPGGDPGRDIAGEIQRLLGKLAMRWSDPIMLDAGYFDRDDSLISPVGQVLSAAQGLVQAVPVIRLSDPGLIREEVSLHHKRSSSGLALRIAGEELDEDPEDLDMQVQALTKSTGSSYSDVDLVLDLGAIEGDVAVLGGSRLVLSILRGLPRLAEYRSVTVASGAFPVDLTGISAWNLAEKPRYDAALWNRVTGRVLARVPDYGDYAIAHPALVTGSPAAPPPQLRYTVADRWLIVKSRKNDPRGHQQFYDVCDVIARHPDFAGSELGTADARIANSRSYGTGNASTWRSIGTAHHADFVVSRLTTLGEP